MLALVTNPTYLALIALVVIMILVAVIMRLRSKLKQINDVEPQTKELAALNVRNLRIEHEREITLLNAKHEHEINKIHSETFKITLGLPVLLGTIAKNFNNREPISNLFDAETVISEYDGFMRTIEDDLYEFVDTFNTDYVAKSERIFSTTAGRKLFMQAIAAAMDLKLQSDVQQTRYRNLLAQYHQSVDLLQSINKQNEDLREIVEKYKSYVSNLEEEIPRLTGENNTNDRDDMED